MKFATPFASNENCRQNGYDPAADLAPWPGVLPAVDPVPAWVRARQRCEDRCGVVAGR